MTIKLTIEKVRGNAASLRQIEDRYRDMLTFDEKDHLLTISSNLEWSANMLEGVDKIADDLEAIKGKMRGETEDG